MKPVFQGNDAATISTAQVTLYRCLETGLKCLSPFMPFITEELYQRLPRHDADKIPSICVAAYPELANCPWKDESIDEQVAFVQKIAKAIRSARSDYNLHNKIKTEAYLFVNDSWVEKYIRALCTLAYCSKIELNIETVPAGCAILTVSDKCEVHLLLKGFIDPSKELEKIVKKQEQLTDMKTKLEQAMAAGDYATKVPEKVQEANDLKLSQTNTELERIEKAIDTLKLMD